MAPRKAFLLSLLPEEAPADLEQFLGGESGQVLFEHFEQQLREAWRQRPPEKAADAPTGTAERLRLPTVPVAEILTAPELAAEPADASAAIPQDQELPPPAAAEAPASPAPEADADAKASAETSQPLAEGSDTMPTSAQKPRPVLFKLRNGKQSQPYAEAITAVAETGVVVLRVELPPELGLAYYGDSGEVKGTPKVSGDFSGAVGYRFVDDPTKTLRIGKVAVYINPDPTLLWKNLESDRSDPFWKEDEQAQLICGKERRIVVARKRGRSHAHVGSFCDDDYFVHHDPDGGWYIAVVADGAGSAKTSRHGSRVAVRAAGHYLKQVLQGETGGNIVREVQAVQNETDPAKRQDLQAVLHRTLYGAVGHAAYKAMQALLDETKNRPGLIASVKDLATTLLVGIARQCGEQWLCAAYWVGDGAVGVYDKNKSIDLLGEVDSGDYSGQTCFLDVAEVSGEAMLKRTRFVLRDHFTGFILMTDGVSDAKFETEARLLQIGAWDQLWADLESGASLSEPDGKEDQRLLAWLDFWSPGNHDDRTIAIIY
ncbi:MAG: protein phosphatase 2C domain-containing protein [Azonexus sp.]|jgi:hypothetical protein|nr:protein phosphatase 2C domain-containing protein [Azonexus sp.]